MKKVVAGLIVLAGLGAAGILAGQAVERDREYLRLIDEGDEALRGGHTFVAIEKYSGAVVLKKDSMLAYLKRGEAHERRGDTPETLTAALRDLRTAADLDPGAPRTLEKLGDVNTHLRRFANAAENYEAYIRLDDHAAPIFYKLALASRGDGRLTRAISALRQAVALDPGFHEAHYVLGLCLKERNELRDARAAFERAIALSPAFIPAREELADLLRMQQQTRQEIEQLNALYALDPNKPERLIAVGRAYLRTGNRELAVMTLGRAADSFKDTRVCTWRLGKCGSMPRKHEGIRATWERPSKPSHRSRRSRLQAAKRSACMAVRWCWRTGMRKPKRFSDRRHIASPPTLKCCRILHLSRSASDIWTRPGRRWSNIPCSLTRIAKRPDTQRALPTCRCS